MYNREPIPKPVDKPKKKKQNGYKDKADRYCYYHHEASGAERHEVYRGTGNRQTSIDHGFQVDLCQECHKEMNDNITDQAKERNAYWKEYWQKVYEDKLIEVRITPKQARSLWMILIGKNYLEPIEEE